MKFLSPGNRVVPSRRLTGTMFWKCFCHLQEFKSLVSFTSQLSQMFREDQWEWWGDEGPVWEHVRQVPWKPGKVSLSKLTICNHVFLCRMLRSRLATYSDHSLLSNRFFLCQNEWIIGGKMIHHSFAFSRNSYFVSIQKVIQWSRAPSGRKKKNYNFQLEFHPLSV